jgi:tRNA (guanine10-N2)-dimethyltransferase
MKYLFELSKEHQSLPTAEIIACLQAEDINYKIIENNEDVLIIDVKTKSDKISNLSNRLSFTFFVDKFIFSCNHSINEIKKKANKNAIAYEGSIAIKYKNRSRNVDSKPIIKILADDYTTNRKVNLKNSDIDVRAIITDSKVYVGLKKAEINRSQFTERRVQNRPFFSPISLHPKLARALVNLSEVSSGETLLDPFCGTGGILIEAGLMGFNVVGSDIEEKMIEGCKKTLEFYNITNYQLHCSDIGEINRYITTVDSIVTDLPYGKSTTTKGEDIIQLYDRSFSNISNLLKTGCKAVVGIQNEDLISLGEKYLSFVEKYSFKVHRSLTRHFVVFEKK